MKILYIITGLDKGGAETQLYNLITSFPKENKPQIKVLAFRKGHYYNLLKQNKIDTKIFEINSITQIPKAIKFIKNNINNFKPDIVHSWLPIANILTKLAKFNSKHKFKLINSIRVKEIKFFIQNTIERLLDFKSDKILVNSNEIKNYLQNTFFFKKKKIDVIYNGFTLKTPDKEKIKKLKEEFKSKKIILTVANFRAQKDYKTNILTVKELLKLRKDDFLFLYAGNGEFLNEMKQFAKEQNLTKNIKFLGKRDDIAELQTFTDIFYLPSLYEGQSNVIIEAMSYKTPIVCTNLPENKEIVKSGLFAPKQSPQIFAKQINKILDKKIKLNLEKNKEFVLKNMDMKQMNKKYYKEYSRVLK